MRNIIGRAGSILLSCLMVTVIVLVISAKTFSLGITDAQDNGLVSGLVTFWVWLMIERLEEAYASYKNTASRRGDTA